MEAEMQELKRENCDMKQYVLALQGEVYGARLAAKYLDKELAGRYAIISHIQHLNKHSCRSMFSIGGQWSKARRIIGILREGGS